MTEWDEYLKINWEKISARMRQPAWIFDTRGILKEKSFKGINLKLWQVGKGLIKTI